MVTEVISIAECDIGDILAADVYNENGITLVVKDTVVNEYIKGKLIGMGIKSVRIYPLSLKKESAYEEFANHYRDVVLQVREILNGIASGKRLEYNKISFLSDNIYKSIQENEQIIKCLQETRYADEYTYTHCLNVAFYSMLIGKWLDFSERKIKRLIQAGLLHDIGKTQIPADILNKKGILTKDEFEIIKRHTIYGHDMLDGIADISFEIKKAVLLHHERIDHSGYPFNAGSDGINIFAKIVAVADVFDAMTSERVYKKRVTPFDAFGMFKTIGFGIFDTDVLNVFLKKISVYYTDTSVILNNGEIGRIAFVPPQDITNPIVVVDSEYIDLARNNEVKVVSLAY